MLSMTGFGRAVAEANDVRYAVEIRSLNHRGLDLKVRSVETDVAAEVEIVRAVRSVIDRGSVTVLVREEKLTGPAALDENRIRETQLALERIRRELGLANPVDLATVARFMPGGPVTASGPRGDALWRVLRPAVAAALEEVRASRAREGEAIGADLRMRLGRLDEVARAIESKAPDVSGRFAQRLKERLSTAAAVPAVDAARLAQEVALMAERLDVTEEIVRLRAHLDHCRMLFDEQGPVGRKLDFVIQEIGRELNTVGSKAQDAAIAAEVIEGKAVLEKMREQAQNIE